jgi:hypothetical protein
MLSNPCVKTEPLDALKYMPFSSISDTYLSLGLDLRERIESNNSALFGLGGRNANTYLIQRAEVHADFRVDTHFQVFVQIEDARPFGKDSVTPVDRDTVDLEQAFVAYVTDWGGGTFKARIGRQEMAFDLQRFISVRDGPNLRQAYDGVWADWEFHEWRLIGYATQPVQYRDETTFDDVSNRHLTFSGIRVERKDANLGDLSAYYSRYDQDGAQFLDASGNERRDVFDVRYSGMRDHFDWDVETMLQSGHVGSNTILAWAFGSIAGYTLADAPWTPRGRPGWGYRSTARPVTGTPATAGWKPPIRCFLTVTTLLLPATLAMQTYCTPRHLSHSNRPRVFFYSPRLVFNGARQLPTRSTRKGRLLYPARLDTAIAGPECTRK